MPARAPARAQRRRIDSPARGGTVAPDGGAGTLPHRARADALRRRPRGQPRRGRRRHPRGGAPAARRSSACRSSSARRTSASARTPRSSTWPSRSPARPPRRSARVARELRRRRRRVALRAARRRRLPQHRRRPRRRRQRARPLPQDAHPRRPALLREVLLHARRPRLPRPSTPPSAAIGTLVCWDQWYPEAARLTALAGADVLFYPTAIGWHPREKARVRRGAARRPGRRCSARTPSPTASTSRP